MIKNYQLVFFSVIALTLIYQGEAALSANLSTLCLQGYFYDPVFENCTILCQQGYYGDYATGNCSACDPTCWSCSGPSSSECVECQVPYTYLFQNYAGISCLSSCSSVGATISEYESCSVCSSTKVYVYNTSLGQDSCESTCPYSSNNGSTANDYCYQFPDGCLNALTNNPKACIECNSSYSTLPISKDDRATPYSECLQTSSSVSSTTQLYYDSSTNSYIYCQANCTDCTVNRSCLTCSNGKKSFGGYCILDACITNTVPNQDSCDCPDGYFADHVNIQCLKCDPSCKTCFGPAPYQCFECSDGYFLHEGTTTCEESCEAGYYFSDGFCVPCDPSCYNCTAGGNQNCSLCSIFFYTTTSGGETFCSEYMCGDYMEYNSSNLSCYSLNFSVPEYSGLIAFDTDVNCRPGYAFDSSRDCVSNCSTGFTHGGFAPTGSYGTVAYVCQEKDIVSFQVNATDQSNIFTVSCSKPIRYLAFKARSWFQISYNSAQLDDSEYFFNYIDDKTLQLNVSTSMSGIPGATFQAYLPDNYQTSSFTSYVVKGTNFTTSPPATAAANFAQGTGQATQIAGTVMTTAVLVQSVVSMGSTAAIRVAFVMQLLQYYRYINVTYPTIVLVLFNSSLQSVVFEVKPSSSSSSFNDKLNAFKSETVEPPGKFYYYGNSAYFIDNCGNTAFTLLLVLCLWGVLKYAIYLLRNSKREKIKGYLNLGYNLVHWNLFFTLLLSNYQPIVLFSFLQITSPDYYGAYGILCIVLLAIFVVIAAATPLVILIVNERYFKLQKQKPTPNKIESSESAGDEKITPNKLEDNRPEILQNNEAIQPDQIALHDSQNGDLVAKNNRKDPRENDNLEDKSPKIQDFREKIFKTQERSINLEENSPSKLLKDRKVNEEGHQNDEYITTGDKNQLKDQQSEAASPLNDRSNNFGANKKQSEDLLRNVTASLEVENKVSDDQISKDNKKEEKTNQKKEDIPEELTSYKVFFKEFKSVSRLHLIFLTILMLRGIIFVGALAFGQGNGLGQAIVIMIAHIVFLSYFLIARPYGQMKQNIIMIANELVLLTASIIIVAIGATNTSNPDQGTVYNLGLGIVACNFGLMIINLVTSVVEVLTIIVTAIIAARNYCRQRREKKSKQKDLNQEKGIQLDMEPNQPPNPALVMTQLNKQLSKSSVTKDKVPKQEGYYFERIETDAAQKLNLDNNLNDQKNKRDMIQSEENQDPQDLSLNSISSNRENKENIEIPKQVLNNHQNLFDNKRNPKHINPTLNSLNSIHENKNQNLKVPDKLPNSHGYLFNNK